MLLFVLTSLIAACQAACNFEQCCGPLGNQTIVPVKAVNKTSDVALNVAQGWQRFFFGSTGTWAMTSQTSGAFYLQAPVPMLLRMSDAFISGDRFTLFVNGTAIGNTSVPIQNSTSYTVSPNEAFVNANYSSGSWILPTGLHRLTIQVLQSTVNSTTSGTGFIRADVNPPVKCANCRPICQRQGPCVCFPRPSLFNPPGCCANSSPLIPPFGPKCFEASGRFTMLKTAMTRNEGIEACRRMNLRLADVNIENFSGVNQFAFLCNGQQVTNTWIHSWNTDNYNEACLVMQSGSFGGNGAITVGACESMQYVMCEA